MISTQDAPPGPAARAHRVPQTLSWICGRRPTGEGRDTKKMEMEERSRNMERDENGQVQRALLFVPLPALFLTTTCCKHRLSSYTNNHCIDQILTNTRVLMGLHRHTQLPYITAQINYNLQTIIHVLWVKPVGQQLIATCVISSTEQSIRLYNWHSVAFPAISRLHQKCILRLSFVRHGDLRPLNLKMEQTSFTCNRNTNENLHYKPELEKL